MPIMAVCLCTAVRFCVISTAFAEAVTCSCFRHSKAARAKPGWLRGWHDDKPPKAITTFGVTLITFKWNEVLDTDCCCSNAIPFLGLLCMSVRVYSLCSKNGNVFLNFQKKNLAIFADSVVKEWRWCMHEEEKRRDTYRQRGSARWR